MSSIRAELRKYNIPDLAIQFIANLTTDAYEGYKLYIERKFMIDELTQFDIGEKDAYFLAFQFNNVNEALDYYYNTLNLDRIIENVENNETQVLNPPRIEEIDQTSTTSIYISAPGVMIEGKQVISAQRDEAIMLISDFYGKRPLDPERIKSFPKYQVADPSLVELNCVICQNNYSSGEVVTLLPCNHYFHVECIEQYFKFNHICPIDKKEL